MRPLPKHLSQLSTTQHGLLSRRQLAKDGFSSRDVQRRIDRRIWQAASDGVVALHDQPLTREAQLWVASLHFRRSALAGASALEVLGLPTPHDGAIHLVGPRQGLVPPLPGVQLHTAVRGVMLDSEPNRVAPVLACLQTLRWAVSDRQGVFQVIWAIQRRFVTLDQLVAAAEITPPAPGSADMRRRLHFIEPGAHSMPEQDFASECRRRHLPEPIRQRERLDARGRRRFTDVEFQVNDRQLVVEIDGLGHLESAVAVEDAWRANEFVIDSAQVLRIPSVALRLDADRFFDQLRRALLSMRQAA